MPRTHWSHMRSRIRLDWMRSGARRSLKTEMPPQMMLSPAAQTRKVWAHRWKVRRPMAITQRRANQANPEMMRGESRLVRARLSKDRIACSESNPTSAAKTWSWRKTNLTYSPWLSPTRSADRAAFSARRRSRAARGSRTGGGGDSAQGAGGPGARLGWSAPIGLRSSVSGWRPQWGQRSAPSGTGRRHQGHGLLHPSSAFIRPSGTSRLVW